jgi:hypothetical protein
MKYLNIALSFLIRNKKLLITIAVILLAFLVYNTFNTNYNNKEIKALKDQIAQKEEQFNDVIEEKEKLQDSSEHFEQIALQADYKILIIKQKAEKLKKEKEAALAALKGISKEDINDFLNKRYAYTPKANIDLELDKNVGNEIVKELTEKDFLVSEVENITGQNKILTGQVDTLKLSLNFSKQAITKADSATKIRTQQLRISQDLTQLLEKDLKTAKRKAFWGQVKGLGIGVAAGIVIGVVAH